MNAARCFSTYCNTRWPGGQRERESWAGELCDWALSPEFKDCTQAQRLLNAEKALYASRRGW
jgi:hypothetical protein